MKSIFSILLFLGGLAMMGLGVSGYENGNFSPNELRIMSSTNLLELGFSVTQMAIIFHLFEKISRLEKRG